MDIANKLLIGFVFVIFLYSSYHKQDAYQSFITGVKKGLIVFMEIYPVMVAMLFAVTLLKESHLLIDMSNIIKSIIPNVPSSIWPIVLFRPISGSASLTMVMDIFHTFGPDSLEGVLASVIQSSTDTTLYVLTLYFGSIQVKNMKNALFIGIIVDVIGMCLAILLVLFFYTC